MAVVENSKQARASAVPLLLAATLLGVLYWGVAGPIGREWGGVWHRAPYGIAFAQIAFAFHCAMSDRPGQKLAAAIVLVAFLVWTAGMQAVFCEQFRQPFMKHFPDAVIWNAYFVYLLLAGGWVARSFLHRPDARLTLRSMLLLTTGAGLFFAVISQEYPKSLLAETIYIRGPLVVLYGLSAFAIFSRRPAWGGVAAMAILGLAAGFGYNRESGPHIRFVGSIVEPVLFTAVVQCWLILLRVSDYYAVSSGR
jgi:hypothetical protein